MSGAAPDDRLEALLRTTGRRPAVPPERAERVRAASREQWDRVLSRRARRRRVWAAVLLATAATVVVALGLTVRENGIGGTPAPAVAGQVEARVGPAWVRAAASGSGSRAVLPGLGTELSLGSELATEDGGRIAIRLASGHSLRLDEGTRARLLDDGAIALERGALYVDSRGPAGSAAGSVEIRTGFGRLRDVGTQFEARVLGSSLVVRVREGRVSWDRAGARLEVRAGEEAEAETAGSAVLRAGPPDGTTWAWIGEVAPMLDIEGRTLGEFLQWIARERGLRLEFASSDLATTAPFIRLNGSIEGMTLDEALASVLVTCRLDHRIHGGVLEVHADQGGSS